MIKYLISKDGIPLWAGDYRYEAAALAAYRKDLGAEAFDYDSVDPEWMDYLDVQESE